MVFSLEEKHDRTGGGSGTGGGGSGGGDGGVGEEGHDTGDLADGAGHPDWPSDSHSAQVVTFDTTDSTARLDTVTIKSGFSASVLIDRSSAILSNAIIIKSGTHGVKAHGSTTPRLINCQFIGNQRLHDTEVRGAMTKGAGAH